MDKNRLRELFDSYRKIEAEIDSIILPAFNACETQEDISELMNEFHRINNLNNEIRDLPSLIVVPYAFASDRIRQKTS